MMPIERIYRWLSGRYGWTPSQLGDMTLGQLALYLGADNVDGDGLLSFPDMRAAMAFLDGGTNG